MIVTSLPKSYILTKNAAIKLIASNFSLEELKPLTYQYSLNINSELLIKLTKGWELSSKLINTPNEALRLWLILDKYFISPGITSYYYSKKSNEITYTFYNQKHTESTHNLNIDLELLSYYFREGYSVVESVSNGYYIKEPYGSTYFIDLTKCNCRKYLLKNFCIHLEIAKSYHNNLRIIRNATLPINY